MTGILVVDDDPQLRNSFEKLLSEEGYHVIGAASGESGLEIVRRDPPDLVILDVRLPGMNGLETFERIQEINPKLPVIIMTAYGTTDLAIQATKLGAFDFMLKPFEIPEMLALITKALEAGKYLRKSVSIALEPSDDVDDALLGRSRVMQEVYKAIGRVASTDATVLIRGESGTGKELTARAIYQHSLRANKPFVVINCVAIPETLLESELFGYEKGAFTGAATRRIGKIEQANNGTIFLDEIGDMPVSIQGKILRLLQEKSIERLGGRSPIPVDVRIIAATNRDLERAIAESTFREDLYYRLRVVTVSLPPLRDRREDIPILVDYFLRKYSGEMGIEYTGFTSEAQPVMTAHSWPGNVRELANTIHKALIFSRGGPITADEMQQAIEQENPPDDKLDGDDPMIIRNWIRSHLTGRVGDKVFVDLTDRFTKMVVAEALQLTGGNRSRAARLLGLSRPTLLAKIDKYGIRTETSVHSD